jgi:hypothetical protein
MALLLAAAPPRSAQRPAEARLNEYYVCALAHFHRRHQYIACRLDRMPAAGEAVGQLRRADNAIAKEKAPDRSAEDDVKLPAGFWRVNPSEATLIIARRAAIEHLNRSGRPSKAGTRR